MRLHGSCLCGQVRYTVDSENIVPAVCHCRHCQKQSGSAFSYVVVVPAAHLSLEGAIKTYGDVGESGGAVRRNFCPECGSPLTSEMASAPGIVAIKAGTLDDSGGLVPALHAWCDSALVWTHVPEGVVRFPRQPPIG